MTINLHRLLARGLQV